MKFYFEKTARPIRWRISGLALAPPPFKDLIVEGINIDAKITFHCPIEAGLYMKKRKEKRRVVQKGSS